jgi:hypothetical protein
VSSSPAWPGKAGKLTRGSLENVLRAWLKEKGCRRAGTPAAGGDGRRGCQCGEPPAGKGNGRQGWLLEG